jgi:hypothetical protein
VAISGGMSGLSAVLIALAFVVLGLVGLTELNPPPQLTELKHSSGQRGPNLEDRRKAMIAQIHLFQTHVYAKTTIGRCNPCDNYRIPRADVGPIPDRWPKLS